MNWNTSLSSLHIRLFVWHHIESQPPVHSCVRSWDCIEFYYLFSGLLTRARIIAPLTNYTITSASNCVYMYTITIRTEGGLPVPFDLPFRDRVLESDWAHATCMHVVELLCSCLIPFLWGERWRWALCTTLKDYQAVNDCVVEGV